MLFANKPRSEKSKKDQYKKLVESIIGVRHYNPITKVLFLNNVLVQQLYGFVLITHATCGNN